MTAMTRPARVGAILALCGIGAAVGPAAGAELKAKTIAAFDRYVDVTNARMVGGARLPGPVSLAVHQARPGTCERLRAPSPRRDHGRTAQHR